MRMIGASVNAELEPHVLPPERILGEHSVYRPLQHALGIFLKQARVRHEPLVTHVPRVLEVPLLLSLPSRDDDLGGIDDDYVVTRVHVWGEHGLVLSSKNSGDHGRQTAEHHAIGIHPMPASFDVFRCCGVSSHHYAYERERADTGRCESIGVAGRQVPLFLTDM